MIAFGNQQLFIIKKIETYFHGSFIKKTINFIFLNSADEINNEINRKRENLQVM